MMQSDLSEILFIRYLHLRAVAKKISRSSSLANRTLLIPTPYTAMTTGAPPGTSGNSTERYPDLGHHGQPHSASNQAANTAHDRFRADVNGGRMFRNVSRANRRHVELNVSDNENLMMEAEGDAFMGTTIPLRPTTPRQIPNKEIPRDTETATLPPPLIPTFPQN
jgi:hypothetical protein